MTPHREISPEHLQAQIDDLKRQLAKLEKLKPRKPLRCRLGFHRYRGAPSNSRCTRCDKPMLKPWPRVKPTPPQLTPRHTPGVFQPNSKYLEWQQRMVAAQTAPQSARALNVLINEAREHTQRVRRHLYNDDRGDKNEPCTCHSETDMYCANHDLFAKRASERIKEQRILADAHRAHAIDVRDNHPTGESRTAKHLQDEMLHARKELKAAEIELNDAYDRMLIPCEVKWPGHCHSFNAHNHRCAGSACEHSHVCYCGANYNSAPPTDIPADETPVRS